jgi:uncharacterized damage-inducible protein DinB
LIRPTVVDLRPPWLVADERQTLCALLQYQRESFVRKVEGVGDEAARRRLVPSDTTLLWLTKHLTHAELLWFVHRFAGQDGPMPNNSVQPDDTLEGAVRAYRSSWVRVDAIVAAASLDDLCRNAGNAGNASNVNLRWILAHMLEETARHAGHADILRELIDGETGR